MNTQDAIYIDRLRGASILRVVLGHLGLGWIFLPYSSYIGIFLPVLFFCSGYISYHIFLKKDKSTISYLVRRMLSILLPFYILYIFSIFVQAAWLGSLGNFSLSHILRALIVAPNYDEMPYPLGQIWFLRVLIFCVLLSPFIYLCAKRCSAIFYLPIAISIVLSFIQTFHQIHREFSFLGHNFFQSIVYGSYFFMGSIIYRIDWRSHQYKFIFFMALCVAIAFSFLFLQNGSTRLSDHAYAPDTFYYLLGVFGIFFVLAFSRQIEFLITRIPGLDWLLKFCSKHSYGIYLNHSFFIVFFEYTLGLKNVIGNLWLAAVKVILVVSCSLLFAIPLTTISNYLIRRLRRIMNLAESGNEVKPTVNRV